MFLDVTMASPILTVTVHSRRGSVILLRYLAEFSRVFRRSWAYGWTTGVEKTRELSILCYEEGL